MKSRHQDSKLKNSTSRQALFNLLKRAIKNKNIHWIREIISDFEKQNWEFRSATYEYSENALHLAARIGDPGIVAYFIEEGITDLTLPNNEGHTAYHTACYHNHIQVLQVLLGNVPLPTPATLLSNYKATILHSSIRKNCGNDCAKYLINLYKDDKDFLNVRNNDGMTALDLAKSKNNLELIEILSFLTSDQENPNETSPAHHEMLDLNEDPKSSMTEVVTANAPQTSSPDKELNDNYLQISICKLSSQIEQLNATLAKQATDTQNLHESLRNDFNNLRKRVEALENTTKMLLKSVAQLQSQNNVTRLSHSNGESNHLLAKRMGNHLSQTLNPCATKKVKTDPDSDKEKDESFQNSSTKKFS